MARRPTETAVRPLGKPERPSPTRRRLPVISLALFTLGAAAGYLLGLTGESTAADAPTTPTSTTAPPVGAGAPGLGIAEYEWTRQIPPERNPNLWAIYQAVEFEGAIYLLIVDDIRNRISRALWKSDNGATWEQMTLDLGDDAVATDLDIYRGRLMISGWLGDRPAIWHAETVGEGAKVDWSLTSLPSASFPLGELQRVFSRVTTEVNGADEISVVASMQHAVDPDVVAGGSDYMERPEMVVTGSSIWTKTIDGSGAVHARAIEIPDSFATKPVSGVAGTDVIEIQTWSSWHSADGNTFYPSAVDGSHGVPVVRALGDRFVASVPGWGDDRYTLLLSADGATWDRSPIQPPYECGHPRPVAVGPAGLLLASETFDHTCTSRDGTRWQIEEVPETAVARGTFVWFDGNESRFLAIAFNANERAVLVSRDGVTWEKVSQADGMSGGSELLAGGRLVAANRTGTRTSPNPWTVWVGEPAPLP